jgi:hypothetical protein
VDPPERVPPGAQQLHHRSPTGAASVAYAWPSTRCSSREP